MVSLMRRRDMVIANKKAARLPPEYQEVEYVESVAAVNGSYIDTGIAARNTQSVVDFAASSVSSSKTNNLLVGSYNASNQRYYAVYKGGSNVFSFVTRANSSKATASYNTNRHTIVFNDASHQVFFDNTLKATDAGFACTGGTNTIYLFGISGFSSGMSVGKIYSAKFIDNDTGNTLRNYVPCYIKATDEAGMYDLATETFYHCSGQTPLVAGPAV